MYQIGYVFMIHLWKALKKHQKSNKYQVLVCLYFGWIFKVNNRNRNLRTPTSNFDAIARILFPYLHFRKFSSYYQSLMRPRTEGSLWNLSLHEFRRALKGIVEAKIRFCRGLILFKHYFFLIKTVFYLFPIFQPFYNRVRRFSNQFSQNLLSQIILILEFLYFLSIQQKITNLLDITGW